MVIFHFVNLFFPPEGNIISQWEVELLTNVARIFGQAHLARQGRWGLGSLRRASSARWETSGKSMENQ